MFSCKYTLLSKACHRLAEAAVIKDISTGAWEIILLQSKALGVPVSPSSAQAGTSLLRPCAAPRRLSLCPAAAAAPTGTRVPPLLRKPYHASGFKYFLHQLQHGYFPAAEPTTCSELEERASAVLPPWGNRAPHRRLLTSGGCSPVPPPTAFPAVAAHLTAV